MTRLPAAVETATLRSMLGLPRPVMRVLAGRPVVCDGQRLDVETQWMMRVRSLAGYPDVGALPLADGRRLMARETALAGGRPSVGSTEDLDLPGGDGRVAARLYVPRSQVASSGPAPLLVYLHGGGMMYGGLDSHDPTCRMLAERADSRVLAVDYRLAPEHPYPAAVDDCWAAYRWVAEHAARLGADPDRIAVGGDSAGGYLAAVVALKAAEEGVPCRFQLLVCPVTNMAEGSESRRMFGSGFMLSGEFMALSELCYLGCDGDPRDPQVSVAFTERIPADLAPALVVTAGFDPLRDEGEAWARRLAEAGTDVALRRYPDLVNGFFNVVGVGRSQRAAVAEIAAQVKAALHA